MATKKVSPPRTAKELYTLLLAQGVIVDKVSKSRFRTDFKYEEELERYTHRAPKGQKSKAVLYNLPGKTLAEKIKSLQNSDEYTFINPRRFFRALLKEVKNITENKIVIGYPLVTLSATFRGHYVYRTENGYQTLSFLSKGEIDELIQSSPAKKVFALVVKYSA